MERVRRLEEAGIIEGYRTVINLENVGLPILAFVRVANAGSREKQLQEVVKTMPEVLEAHHVIGNDCFFIKVAVPTVKHLERILGALGEYSQTTTSIVLSSPVNGRLITPVDALFTPQPAQNGKIRR
jgi:Lrp/AsnC family leucine-responsive transcriptional regulator